MVNEIIVVIDQDISETSWFNPVQVQDLRVNMVLNDVCGNPEAETGGGMVLSAQVFVPCLCLAREKIISKC